MRIGPGYLNQVSQKGEASSHPSKEEIVKRVQSQTDFFYENTRASSIEELVENFSLSPDPLEIVGKANAPKISDEAVEKLRQQVAAAAAENKSNKKE